MGSWLLLLCPVTAFGLGVWQVRRKQWKESVIEALEGRLTAPAIPLPTDKAEIEELDFRRVTILGEFDHDMEVLLGPRTLLREAFDGNAGDPGAHVVTPFVRAENGERILVNRGWVPDERQKKETRLDGLVKGQIELQAIVINQAGTKPNQFVPENDPERQQWYWMDREAMAEALDTSNTLVEATSDVSPYIKSDLYPIGGQSQVNIRNEHMQYIVTWFALSAATFGMWLVRVRPDRLLSKIPK